MENNNRLIRRFFKCTKCKEIEAKLVNPFINNIYCSKCSTKLNEISESNYRKYKNKEKAKQNIDLKEGSHQTPYMPKEDLLRKASDKYNNINTNLPSLNHNNKKHEKNKNKKENKHNRHQSSNHYSNMNFNNINNNNNNYNNINNNINLNNINHINFNENNQNRHERRNTHRRREHSMDNHNSNNFFSDFFRGMGFQPFVEFDFSMETPFMGNSRHVSNPFRITVQRQNVSNDVFDPIFSSFGSFFNGIFQDNFSSNFSSNYRGNFFDEIIRILERNQAEAKKNAHPPASEESLKKLKKFNMNEKYCKKDKKGKYELPNCCICLNEICKGEKTVLLPCGHMFHWKCCLTWLKSNNTCPMCRFEIK